MEQNSDLPQAEPTKVEQAQNLYPNDVLANSELANKLSGLTQNPQVSKYLGKATKVIAACAISGCILLVIAVMAVANLFDQIFSKIGQ